MRTAMKGKETDRRWNGKWGRGLLLAALLAVLCLTACGGSSQNVKDYREKAGLLEEQLLTKELAWDLGIAPAGSVGHAVFVSVCDRTQRADVYSGTGETLEAAWKAANQKAEAALSKSGLQPVWVKADVVYLSETVDAQELYQAVHASRHEFFRYGAAFDGAFETALLEAELNGAKIYDYDAGGIDLSYLNSYLESAGRAPLEALPEAYTVFQCFGWLCDEENAVYMLDSNGLDYGRRTVETMDKACAEEMIFSASDFLLEQIREDGSFIYGYYPRFDNEIENYNVVRHASTIWSLLCRYRMAPDEELAGQIDRTVDYLLSQVVYESQERAYLWEEKGDEIKLGGCGMAVMVLTEYMDVFRNDKYEEICRQLGNGILEMLDQETGEYYHVLNGDFSPKEEFRAVSYDGEATAALCRLYGLTRERKWLDAAKSTVDHFIAADYSQHKDHWVAYSMNEVTKYVTDRVDYYAFALRSVQNNLQEIHDRGTTHHTYLELLLSTFELYDRMLEGGAAVEGFNEGLFLKTIYARANRMLDGFFYPEYAMYMENPERILGAFMIRHDGYRVRIDDVHHNIAGYYLYSKNYDKLVEYGMLDLR